MHVVGRGAVLCISVLIAPYFYRYDHQLNNRDDVRTNTPVLRKRGMDFESYTHSFIIKIWLEETAEEAGVALWRGRVTHVPSGERRYISDLDEIRAFIVPYLEKMGVKFKEIWGVKQRVRQLKTCLERKLGNGGRGTE